MTDTFDRVSSCMRKVRSFQGSILPSQFFKKDLHFESIDVVDLLFELEQEFGCFFGMNEFGNYVVEELKSQSWDFSVEQLCAFVEKRR